MRYNDSSDIAEGAGVALHEGWHNDDNYVVMSYLCQWKRFMPISNGRAFVKSINFIPFFNTIEKKSFNFSVVKIKKRFLA